MTYIFYNKLLLRVLVSLTGVGIALAAWNYVSLSAQKLPEEGARDALAIISFLIAGWLVMLIAEVVDNHYVRVFGTLALGLGAYISYPWIFLRDGPALLQLPGAAGPFRVLSYGFWSAVVISVLMLVLLVTRLIMDRATYGRVRQAVAARGTDAVLGTAPAGAGEKPRPGELPPIPVDTSPLAVSIGRAVQVPAAEPVPVQREPAPVKRLEGIGGVYMGLTFDLAPGSYGIGRQDADILLADDAQVSRAHARLTVDDNGIASITDNGSTNGTYLNNNRVQQAALCPGDVLRIGTTLLKVEG